MSAAHTPGPWTLERNHFGYAIYGPPGTETGTPGIRIVCEVRTTGHADATALANANLLMTAIEPRYTHADVATAHTKGYELGMAQRTECVNTHDDLLIALKDARNYVECTVLNSTSQKTRWNYAGCLSRIEAAIAKATGSPT